MEYKPRRKINYDNIDQYVNDETICKKTKYNIKNHDKIKEQNHQYYLKNKEKIIKAVIENNKKNKERHYEYNKKSRINKKLLSQNIINNNNIDI